MRGMLPKYRHVRPELDTGGERARVDEAHSPRRLELRPERCARTEHDGMDDDPIFIHKPATHELTGEVRSSDGQVAVELITETVEHGAHVALHQARVVRDVLEAGGEDDLRQRIPNAC